MKLLPGFRDFYPDDCARRDYLQSRWREIARRYGFVEYDGPVLESTELYRKKSGGELVGQLFAFTDKGEREVALRPEMTPTLARMVIAKEREFRKPLKWFSISNFFRYEKPQRGRLREFYQFNADVLGEASAAADAELIAMTVDIHRALGFGTADIVVRLSSRTAWADFLARRDIPADRLTAFLDIVDKLERADEKTTREKLSAFNLTPEDLQAWLAAPEAESEGLRSLLADLEARGVRDFVEIDLRIVRGLAYYTGLVFEVFDRRQSLRALAGGGRYDTLLSTLSDGKVDMPAAGFGMGDVTIGELISETPVAADRMRAWIHARNACDIYVVIAREEHRAEAVRLSQQLRDAGHRVEYPLSPAKVGKQYQTAEQAGARFAVLVGDEWPQVKLKTLATREERLVLHSEILTNLRLNT